MSTKSQANNASPAFFSLNNYKAIVKQERKNPFLAFCFALRLCALATLRFEF